MSKKLEAIALNNIKEQLKEIENRTKLAKYNIKHFKDNPHLTKIAAQNVLYAANNLKTDLEILLEVTNNGK